MTTAAKPLELSPQHAEVVAATLPLVGAHVGEITSCFYGRMFGARPELLRNLFNRGNQAQGAQQRALAASIATFATHLVDPDLPHPADMLGRIAHKHTSLGIVAEQYPIVHEHLFAAIVEVLGADVVTAEVAEAWDRVYWIMADTLIALENDLYRGAGVDAGDVYRRLRVTGRVDDPSGAVLVTVDCGAHVAAPAQYVSVGVTLPDGARQLRQYSLTGISETELTFAVKPVPATGDAPAGEVSNWIRDNLRVGDLLDVTVPFGDLPTPGAGSVALISAGIGVTPMISLLEYLVQRAPQTPVRVLHADRSDEAHPLRQQQRELVGQLPNATLDVWYEDGVVAGSPGAHPGRMNLDGVDLAEDCHVYLCGPDAFVQAVRAQLVGPDGKGLAAERVHCELFSPNDWLLS
ncbi:hemin transporter [Mycolicibacterium insubricum]|jgi:nitric oxide dioxygenase|uniref:nitric oxide dioxygenase n=1 Tax=Mycolicibacterium insubricum TaxID=444597 RepID=A0A1X0D8N1_9MYCO|nr:globin domain-containing protein [Mycolicibacterium insubricum]MCB9440832.1 hemin transporter [Mycolicibacterium sp.]MCV7081269.1 hemin transporter [Mycolicibacterium insubricum]ORA68532.1 hemin transporter [Mycolicibacterium insubricum]BBZ65848.1 hemin transporter [Mycolicibacterium insubricum]